jgi:hypothetical protein
MTNKKNKEYVKIKQNSIFAKNIKLNHLMMNIIFVVFVEISVIQLLKVVVDV